MKATLLLSKLRISGIYMGKDYLADAIEILLDQKGAIHAITKEVYLIIAEKHRVPLATVERNIRTVINVFWERGDRVLLDEIVGYHVIEKPKNGEFIVLLADYLREQEAGADLL